MANSISNFQIQRHETKWFSNITPIVGQTTKMALQRPRPCTNSSLLKILTKIVSCDMTHDWKYFHAMRFVQFQNLSIWFRGPFSFWRIKKNESKISLIQLNSTPRPYLKKVWKLLNHNDKKSKLFVFVDLHFCR